MWTHVRRKHTLYNHVIRGWIALKLNKLCKRQFGHWVGLCMWKSGILVKKFGPLNKYTDIPSCDFPHWFGGTKIVRFYWHERFGGSAVHGTSTNFYNAKWLSLRSTDAPRLSLCHCRGHTLRQPSECSVWRLRTSGTHYRTTFGWWRGLAVTRWSRSTKLLYAGPG